MGINHCAACRFLSFDVPFIFVLTDESYDEDDDCEDEDTGSDEDAGSDEDEDAGSDDGESISSGDNIEEDNDESEGDDEDDEDGSSSGENDKWADNDSDLDLDDHVSDTSGELAVLCLASFKYIFYRLYLYCKKYIIGNFCLCIYDLFLLQKYIITVLVLLDSLIYLSALLQVHVSLIRTATYSTGQLRMSQESVILLHAHVMTLNNAIAYKSVLQSHLCATEEVAR